MFSEMAEPAASNLRGLSGYRLHRYAPGSTLVPAIMEAVGSGVSLSAGVGRASLMLRLEPSTVQAHLLHLAFIGVLEVSLDEPLSMETGIAPAQEKSPMPRLAAAS